MSLYAIVADIGGTFARFSRIHLETLVMDKIAIYPCSNFKNLDEVFISYQTEHDLSDIKQAALAIACPILNDKISLTNNSWHFSIKAFQQRLHLEKLKVINDFNAIAMSLPALTQNQCQQIGPGQAQKNQIKVVLGAGTGLGQAYLVPNNHGDMAYAGEGGHASWGAQTEQEWFIYSKLKQQYDHVSYERLLSGSGLENVYLILCQFHKQNSSPLKAADIIAKALTQEDKMALATIYQFFASLGSYCGDMALTFGAFGGVYIAGGIVPRLLSLIKTSPFRVNFENKGRFRAFNTSIPTYVITEQQPGLIGAAMALKQTLIGEHHVLS